ncbi:hypothetical protein NDU88_001582 [Pleurodeles waltl]|uniref:Uncharacterized protein n=1 Tax=Pleurodeles waltl TaxID=8319 RepID=A0AAV7TIR8_PLEWA|nr:hypothetical protein NDU88_001582 [Pleurodeles waltl]
MLVWRVCEDDAGADELTFDYDEGRNEWEEGELHDEDVDVLDTRKPERGEAMESAVCVFQRSNADKGIITGKQAWASVRHCKDRSDIGEVPSGGGSGASGARSPLGPVIALMLSSTAGCSTVLQVICEARSWPRGSHRGSGPPLLPLRHGSSASLICGFQVPCSLLAARAQRTSARLERPLRLSRRVSPTWAPRFSYRSRCTPWSASMGSNRSRVPHDTQSAPGRSQEQINCQILCGP